MDEEFTEFAMLLAWKPCREFIILQARDQVKMKCCGGGVKAGVGKV
jgi:hypothetical protein